MRPAKTTVDAISEMGATSKGIAEIKKTLENNVPNNAKSSSPSVGSPCIFLSTLMNAARPANVESKQAKASTVSSMLRFANLVENRLEKPTRNMIEVRELAAIKPEYISKCSRNSTLSSSSDKNLNHSLSSYSQRTRSRSSSAFQESNQDTFFCVPSLSLSQALHLSRHCISSSWIALPYRHLFNPTQTHPIAPYWRYVIIPQRTLLHPIQRCSSSECQPQRS